MDQELSELDRDFLRLSHAERLEVIAQLKNRITHLKGLNRTLGECWNGF